MTDVLDITVEEQVAAITKQLKEPSQPREAEDGGGVPFRKGTPVNEKFVPVFVSGNETEGFTATTSVLAGCIAEGDTIEEALADFNSAFEALLKAYEEQKMAIPWKSAGVLPLNDSSVRIFVLDGV